MQAKRGRPKDGRIAFDQKAAPSAPAGEQIDVFAWNCYTDRIAGLYCIYSDVLPKAPPPAGLAPGCPHGDADFRQWACTVLPVDTAFLLRRLSEFRAETVLSHGVPWYQLVCADSSHGATESVFRCFTALRDENTALRGATDRLPYGDDQYPGISGGWLFPSREPPEQVAAAFSNELDTLEPWADLTGVVLIDGRGVQQELS